MLKPIAFANSFASVAAVFYLFLFVFKLLTPPLFNLLLNSQVFGADIASQVPKVHPINFLGILIAVSLSSWSFGYLVAVFYNRFAK